MNARSTHISHHHFSYDSGRAVVLTSFVILSVLRSTGHMAHYLFTSGGMHFPHLAVFNASSLFLLYLLTTYHYVRVLKGTVYTPHISFLSLTMPQTFFFPSVFSNSLTSPCHVLHRCQVLKIKNLSDYAQSEVHHICILR